MAMTITADTLMGPAQLPVEDYPNVCPLCHASIHPAIQAAGAILDMNPQTLEAVFRCASRKCQALFVAYYSRHAGQSATVDFKLVRLAPSLPAPVDFGPEIARASPTFGAIYNQALAAESYQLDQLAGMGYRKALEFLIKDFTIAQRPADKKSIEKVLLGKCIDLYVDDVRVKECARRATWLGNDETHYLRRWEGKDIADLKTLIRLTVNWIESVILTEKYKTEMPE